MNKNFPEKKKTGKILKVRHHCHFTGKYRGAAHNDCNLKCCKPLFIPVLFHNLQGYDAHLFIKQLAKISGDLKEMNIIRSENHDIYSMTVNKVALSANDDKRLICENKINTLALRPVKN